MKKSISIVLLATIVLHSCSSYERTTVSLQEAVNKGKVKVKTQDSRTSIFHEVIRDSTGYYGVSKEYSVGLDSTISRSIHLKKNMYRANEIWVELNSDTEVRGVLTDVTDTSIWVVDYIKGNSPNNKQDYISQNQSIKEYLAKDIIKIKIRRIKQVRQTAWKGSLIGTGVLITVGYFIGAYTWGIETALVFGSGFGVVGAAAGAIIGAIIGSSKKVYFIDGSTSIFQQYQVELESKAASSFRIIQ